MAAESHRKSVRISSIIWLRLVIDCEARPSGRPERSEGSIAPHNGFVFAFSRISADGPPIFGECPCFFIIWLRLVISVCIGWVRSHTFDFRRLMRERAGVHYLT